VVASVTDRIAGLRLSFAVTDVEGPLNANFQKLHTVSGSMRLQLLEATGAVSRTLDWTDIAVSEEEPGFGMEGALAPWVGISAQGTVLWDGSEVGTIALSPPGQPHWLIAWTDGTTAPFPGGLLDLIEL
jgi:hypothetical protein